MFLICLIFDSWRKVQGFSTFYRKFNWLLFFTISSHMTRPILSKLPSRLLYLNILLRLVFLLIFQTFQKPTKTFISFFLPQEAIGLIEFIKHIFGGRIKYGVSEIVEGHSFDDFICFFGFELFVWGAGRQKSILMEGFHFRKKNNKKDSWIWLFCGIKDGKLGDSLEWDHFIGGFERKAFSCFSLVWEFLKYASIYGISYILLFNLSLWQICSFYSKILSKCSKYIA